MRYVLYSHDSYGLGHIRRTISVVTQLLKLREESRALVLTGAPRAHYLSYPEGCDYVKLPSVTKGVDGHYEARDLDLSLHDTLRLRTRLIESALASFPPQALIVDHTPQGLCGELLPVLNRRTQPGNFLRVLGLRDVIDEPEAVRAAWAKDGVLETLRDHYELILCYGSRALFDPIAAYGIPPEIGHKIVFTGYITRNGARLPVEAVLAQYAPRTGQLVALTAGGGGDGNVLVRTMLEAYRALGPAPEFELLIVTGPLMSPSKRKRFKEQAAALPGVTLVEFHDDLPAIYRAASYTVSMAGYNTVCELATAGCRSLLVPRCTPRREQLVRAQLLAQRGVARLLSPEKLKPETLIAAIRQGLQDPRPSRRWGLDFGGLPAIAGEIDRAVQDAALLRRAALG
jgi:predicted glycosyltransferase